MLREKKEKAKNVATTGTLIGTVAAGDKLGAKTNRAINKYVEKKQKTTITDAKIDKGIRDLAEKNGVCITNQFGGDYFQPTKRIRDDRAKELKYIKKINNSKLIPKKLKPKLRKLLNKDNAVTSRFNRHIKKSGYINVSDPSIDTLAHEYGHSQFYKKGEKSVLGKVGEVAHNLTPTSKRIVCKYNGKLTLGASIANGYRSGVLAEKKKKEGKKESTINKVSAVGLPLALSAPVLIAEGAATGKGLKTMKKLGADKKLMKESAKRLGAAWGTYASKPIADAVSGQVAREVGKLHERSKEKQYSDNTYRNAAAIGAGTYGASLIANPLLDEAIDRQKANKDIKRGLKAYRVNTNRYRKLYEYQNSRIKEGRNLEKKYDQLKRIHPEKLSKSRRRRFNEIQDSFNKDLDKYDRRTKKIGNLMDKSSDRMYNAKRAIDDARDWKSEERTVKRVYNRTKNYMKNGKLSRKVLAPTGIALATYGGYKYLKDSKKN